MPEMPTILNYTCRGNHVYITTATVSHSTSALQNVGRFQILNKPRWPICMGWLWLVGFWKWYVSFVEYRLFYRALLQKRPISLRSPLIVATPYVDMHKFTPRYSKFSEIHQMGRFLNAHSLKSSLKSLFCKGLWKSALPNHAKTI